MIDIIGVILCVAGIWLSMLGGMPRRHAIMAAGVALLVVFVVRLGLTGVLALRPSEGILLSSALYTLALFAHFVVWMRPREKTSKGI